MKKTTKRFLAIAVAAMMMLSTATAFAADGGSMQSAVTNETAAAGAVTDTGVPALPEIQAPVVKKAKSLKADGDYPAIAINYDSDTSKLSGDTVTYGGKSDPDNYDYCMIEAKATGKLWFALKANPSNTAGVTVAVGTPNGSTFSISRTTYLSAGALTEGFGCMDVVAGGRYVLGFNSTSSGQIAFAPFVIPYSTRALPAGKAMISSGVKGSGNAASTVLYKITPSKSGYIDVALSNGQTTSGKVTLLNKNKKAVSPALSYYTKSKTNYVVFGVKKGQTYYLKVTDCKGLSSSQYMYAIAYTVKAGKIRSNTKKSKAVSLKRKAKYTVTTAPAKGKKGKDWYKFKVTKKRTTQIRIDATNVKSGTMKVAIYCGKKKVGSATVAKGKVNTFKVTYSTTYGKAKKGKYYVAISKSAKMNGQYRIKYLK